MSNNGYVISVGHVKPQKVIVANPNKRGEPTGDQFDRVMSIGKHLIINGYFAWGRRIVDGKPFKAIDGSEDNRIEVTNQKYKGELEFLTYGDSRGYMIECRYLSMSNSLDVDYQNNVQKLKIDPQKTSPFVELDAGENKFDYKKESLKIEFLKNHPQNRDSKSKNIDPEIRGHEFFEVTDEMVDKTLTKRIEAGIDAGLAVKSLANDSTAILNLFQILGRRPEFGETDSLSNPAEIYKAILRFTQTNPSDFDSLVGAYKKRISNAFELAKSHNALDLTKNGHIVLLVENKKEQLLNDAEGKGEEMIQYCLENYAKPEVYSKMNLLEELVKKLK